MFEYPPVVSRTLDPAGKSLLTVVALHDHEISDADVNLIQDLQGYKRHQLLKDGPTTSGCLTWGPMSFDTSVPNTFTVPSFDVLFNGEEVTVTGYLSADQTLSQVSLPAPAPWPARRAGQGIHRLPGALVPGPRPHHRDGVLLRHRPRDGGHLQLLLALRLHQPRPQP